MSLIKGKQEFRVILDFSKDKLSKNKVKQALRNVEVRELAQLPDSTTYTFVENDIRVGIYQVRLFFSSISSEANRSQLKQYGGFRIAIYERNKSTLKHINLDTHKLFKNQYWVKQNHDYNVRMKTLTDIIMYLKRLDNLKCFS